MKEIPHSHDLRTLVFFSVLTPSVVYPDNPDLYYPDMSPMSQHIRCISQVVQFDVVNGGSTRNSNLQNNYSEMENFFVHEQFIGNIIRFIKQTSKSH